MSKRFTYPHMCRDGHPELGHAESTGCPICFPVIDGGALVQVRLIRDFSLEDGEVCADGHTITLHHNLSARHRKYLGFPAPPSREEGALVRDSRTTAPSPTTGDDTDA